MILQFFSGLAHGIQHSRVHYSQFVYARLSQDYATKWPEVAPYRQRMQGKDSCHTFFTRRIVACFVQDLLQSVNICMVCILLKELQLSTVLGENHQGRCYRRPEFELASLSNSDLFSAIIDAYTQALEKT